MFTITYETFDADCNTISTETANFIDIDIFKMLDRVEAIEWTYYNEKGKNAGGNKGSNAHPNLLEFAESMAERRAA